MHPPLSPRRAVLPVVAAVLAVAGCGRSEDVKTYTVAKPKDVTAPPPAGAAPQAPESGAKVRLLGAILPTGNGQSFFVKMSGPAEAVEPHVAEFEQFVQSVTLTGDPKDPVKYTPPAGWRPGPKKMMRQVTFLVGSGDKPLEAYVSEPFAGSVLDNVNRWRREVGAAEVKESDLPTVTRELPGPAKKVLVDATGTGGTGGMSAPFMNKK